VKFARPIGSDGWSDDDDAPVKNLACPSVTRDREPHTSRDPRKRAETTSHKGTLKKTASPKKSFAEPATKTDRTSKGREGFRSMVFYECVVTTKNTCRKLHPDDGPLTRADSLSHPLSFYRLSFLDDPDEAAVY
jgi:hypothetical protein